MKRSVAITLLSALLLSSYTALPNQAAAATVASAKATGYIVSGVNFRDQPSVSGKIIGFLKEGSEVAVLDQSNKYFYKVQSEDGTVGYVSANSKYIKVNANSTPAPTQPSLEQSAKVVYGVNLRSKPSTSGKVITMLSKGTSLTILEQSNASFYKVRTSDGRTGYVSTNDKYLSIEGQNQPTVPQPSPGSGISRQIDQVIETGMKYLGTPYEFGSNRNTTTTFDCSDFIRQIFKETLGITLPTDSRKQGQYIKDNDTAVYNIDSLKRGDLVFFMSYKGSSAKSYQGINKSTARITHVAMYLGDGKLLHTYSKESGGVILDKLDGAWVHRFLYGGSVLK
ncbi:SH3 domain-containing C40 family peptidase [Paenibacillus sanguinis]|uniref:C40 family peptidase n=1 Tax=Paenibacillus sanguinis TaxID=225906 RepID=UPI0003649EB7|nr:SH3 domain-containing C40 family peptidase [Paenibacillus sanguinis]